MNRVLVALVTGAIAVGTVGAAAPAVAAPAVAAATRGSIYVIGDSWSAGLFADPDHALAQDAAEDLDMDAVVDAQSGTGYVTAPIGTSTYLQRAAEIPVGTKADLVVIQGGSNDDGADGAALLTAVEQTVAEVRLALPSAQIVLLGPGPDPWPITDAQSAVDEVLETAAVAQGVVYVSPMQEQWFTSSTVRSIIDPITAHPTVSGDEILGRDLANDLAPLLQQR